VTWASGHEKAAVAIAGGNAVVHGDLDRRPGAVISRHKNARTITTGTNVIVRLYAIEDGRDGAEPDPPTLAPKLFIHQQRIRYQKTARRRWEKGNGSIGTMDHAITDGQGLATVEPNPSRTALNGQTAEDNSIIRTSSDPNAFAIIWNHNARL